MTTPPTPARTVPIAPTPGAAADVAGASFCGLPLTFGCGMEEVIERAFTRPKPPVLTTFVNPHAYHLARKHPGYAADLRHFDFVLPDGIGVVWGVRLLTGRRIERMSFDSTSLALPVLERACRERRVVLLIGGRPGVAARAALRLQAHLPGLQIGGALDGFQDEAAYVRAVRSLRPDIVVCGTGAPRQEALLLHLVRQGGWCGLGYTCGGYLDQLEEGVRYYPPVIDAWNMRWLYRMAREPGRLWRRYAIEYQAFGRALCRGVLSGRLGGLS